jgi:hypothetical protein
VLLRRFCITRAAAPRPINDRLHLHSLDPDLLSTHKPRALRIKPKSDFRKNLMKLGKFRPNPLDTPDRSHGHPPTAEGVPDKRLVLTTGKMQ